MARFNESEYAGYVRLMRDLKLEHTFQAGDRFGRDLEGGKIGVGIQGINVRRPEDWWLPMLADLLGLLEEVDVDWFQGRRARRAGIGYIFCRHITSADPDAWDYATEGTGSTPEEALAQLWMAIKASR